MWIKIKYFLLKKEDIQHVEINSRTGFWETDYVFSVTVRPTGNRRTIIFNSLKEAQDLLDDVYRQMREVSINSDIIKLQLDDIQRKVSCMSDSSNRSSNRLKRKADEQC